jgi:transposase
MDKLYNRQMERVQEISASHTCRILGGSIGLLFYDVTTLYFEASPRDDMRQAGFSKDCKTSEAQVVLGLLVSQHGYPLSYSIFNGSQYEGYTMIPVIDDFVRRFDLRDFVVVADSGLMSARNVKLLRSAGYRYIVGARIKSEATAVKEWILSLERRDGAAYENKRADGDRLIVGYSSNRAANDARNRYKGVERLRKSYKSGILTKANVNRRGYNKFLEISKDVEVTISDGKIAEDEKWDGLKGYVTNTDLPAEEAVAQYRGLWVVERAFRVGKGTLEMRPMFHFTERRIEAHVCICFVAYKVYKELERIIAGLGIKLSVDKVLDIAKTITTLRVHMPNNRSFYTKTMFLTDDHKAIRPLFEVELGKL